MSTQHFQLFSWMLLGLLLAVLMSACTKSSKNNNNKGSGGTGSITATIVWPGQSASLSITPFSHPGAVETIRAIVTGPDMSTITKDFNAALHAGSISGVPAGNNRTLVFQGLDAGSSIIYQGVSAGIPVFEGSNSDAGTVTMVVVTPGTPPADVTGFSATGGDSEVALTWTNPGDATLTGVMIRRNVTGFPANTTDGVLVYDNFGTAFNDTAVTNGTLYRYTIFAHDALPQYAAGGAGAQDSATPVGGGGDVTPPGDVTSFTATAGDAQITLAWNNPGDGDFTGARILRRSDVFPTSPGDGTVVFDGIATTFTNTGLTDGTPRTAAETRPVNAYVNYIIKL